MKEPMEVAAILYDIYYQTFSGKSSGRFQIPRKRLKELSGRNFLRDAFLEELTEKCSDFGLVLINLDETFIVMKRDTLFRYRKPADDIIGGYEYSIPNKNSAIQIGTLIRKEFDEGWFEGSVKSIYDNGKILVIYEDGDYGLSTADTVEPIKEEQKGKG